MRCQRRRHARCTQRCDPLQLHGATSSSSLSEASSKQMRHSRSSSSASAPVTSALAGAAAAAAISSSAVAAAFSSVIGRALAAAAAAAATLATPAQALELGWYTTRHDVAQHARIDLDVKDISSLVGEERWDNATEIYQEGKYSSKTTSLRNLQSFSLDIKSKAESIQTDKSNEQILAEFYLFEGYWGADDYANTFVLDALQDMGQFDGLDAAARSQLAKKGVQYQVVNMYMLYELAKGLFLCFEGADDDGTLNWDEGAAFFIGSLLEGKPDLTQGQSGQLQYTLASKRASSFGTTDESRNGPAANANAAAIDAFTKGLQALSDGNCEEASGQYKIIRKQMQIALVQGMLQYSHKSQGDDSAALAEGWAFTAAIMPFLHEADAANARIIRDNMEINSTQFRHGDRDAVFKSAFAILPNLCISCAELGVNAFIEANDIENLECTVDQDALNAGCDAYLKPAEKAKKDVPVGTIVGLVIAGLVVLGIIFAGMHCINKKADDKPSPNVESGNTSGVPPSTGAATGTAGQDGTAQPAKVEQSSLNQV
mmetsp:Transcript_17534/g.50170  ORF Transcript_17534/g.50170 Transcript_17534/m.50170 type:complete len:543 (-) Transcript_17534:80-1708(-)